MSIWFARAAIGRLADEKYGWEPINREMVFHEVVFDRDTVIAKYVGKDAGNVWLRSNFIQFPVGNDEILAVWTGATIAPKILDVTKFPFSYQTPEAAGTTVTAVLWPAQKAISEDILPDTVATLGQLETRAYAYGLGDQFRQLLADLETRFKGKWTREPIPVAVVFCVRRPFHLMGRASDIEVLVYWLKFHRPKAAKPPPALGKDDPVFPARQVDMPSPALFRHVSGAPVFPDTSIIGCGSVGSNLAMHLARSGARILAVSDRAMLRPHNMARHALARHPFPRFKATELAIELGALGDTPASNTENVITALSKPADLLRIVPAATGLLVNTTASRLVREALSAGAGGKIKARIAEVTLFGRGDGAFVFVEGKGGNPSLSQLEASLYASVSERERQLLFDPDTGLTQVQIGDGCGSLTMPMTDARLSAMTAAATEEITRMATTDAGGAGQVAIGVRDGSGLTTSWRRMDVPAFTRVKVEGGDWTLDISEDVVQRMRSEIAAYPAVETGGLLVGTCNSRLRAITVVDILPAPEDSKRSAALFVLGTKGMRKLVSQRYRESGGSLFDVGTWHSHLADQGASPLDWKTAKSLAEERPPPAVLLICTPKRFLAITGTNRA